MNLEMNIDIYKYEYNPIGGCRGETEEGWLGFVGHPV